MKNTCRKLLAAVAVISSLNHSTQMLAQGTAFMYQGKLNDGGNPANGSYDIAFSLYSAANGGSTVTGPVTNSAAAVSDGVFSATLDFGVGVFNGASYWLQLSVRTNGNGAFSDLLPRQPLLPVPYAIYATTAGSALQASIANSVAAANISGTIALNQLPAGLVTNSESGLSLNGTFTGNGGGLANLNYGAITNPPSIPSTANLVATNDSRALSLANPANRISGMVAGNGAGLTNVSVAAANLTGPPILINFDSVDATGGQVDATAYLASFGITLTGVSPPGSVFIFNQTNYYGGGCAYPSSSPNFLLQNVGGSPNGITYTLLFSAPLQSLSFTRCGIGGNCATPGWTATAYSNNVAVGSVGVCCPDSDLGAPARTYSLAGPGITSLTITADGYDFTAISSVPLDDLYLVPQQLFLTNNQAGVNLSGSFSGALSGNGAGLTNLNPANLAAGTAAINISGTATAAANAASANNFSGNLGGDVTGSQTATVVASVGGQSAATIASGAGAANAATPGNVANAIVKRDSLGNFSAATITAAAFGGDGGGLTNLNASRLASGTVPLTQLPAAVVTNNETAVSLNGSFSGNGGGLTNLNALSVVQRPIAVSFDSVDATGGQVDATAYLASLGIALTNVNPPGSVFIFNQTNYYGGGCAYPSSSPNFLLQNVGGSPNGITYTLLFSAALQSLSFTRCGIGGNCATPGWTATAYSNNVAVGSVGVCCPDSDLGAPARTYTLAGPGITSLTITANGYNFTAISSVPLDDLYLVPQQLFLTNNQAGVNLSGSFAGALSGDGAGLTNLNPANLAGGTAAINISGTAATASNAAAATSFIGNLSGDVTGTQNATVVATVGGQSAANIASGAGAANAATPADIANAIVKRDSSGNFSAATITAAGFGGDGGGLTNLNASRLASGTVPLTQLPSAVVTNNETAVSLNGSFSGDGGGLTNLLNGLLTVSSTAYINFDSVNTSTGRVDATSYLGSSGISLTNVNPPGSVFIVNSSIDGCSSPSSSPNWISQQVPGSSLVSYTLVFGTPLQSLTFTRCAVSSGCASPGWTATAYAGAVPFTNVGPGVNCINCDLGRPAHTYTLNGPGITSLTISANGADFSAYSSPPLDDFYLIPQPGLSVSGAVSAVSFNGNGSGLANLNATQLTSGTISLAQLPPAVVTNNASVTLSNLTINGFINGNGGGLTNLPSAWQTVSGTNQTAASGQSYLLTNNALDTLILPASPNVGDVVTVTGTGSNSWEVLPAAGHSIIGQIGAGIKWTEQTNVQTNANWAEAAMSADGRVLAVTRYDPNGVSSIWISTNSGSTWSAPFAIGATIEVMSCSSDGSHLVTAFNNSLIYTSTNYGATWTAQGGSPANYWTSVASSSDGSHLVAVTYRGGGIYTSANFGVNWAEQTGPPAGNYYSVASSSDGSHVVTAEDGGAIYTSTNFGVNWIQQSGAPTSAYWNSVASDSTGHYLVAASGTVGNGAIYTSTDWGITWTKTGAPGLYWDTVASSSDGRHLVAAANGGGIWVSADFGSTWTQGVAPTANWVSVASSADGNSLVATVYGGGIYTSATMIFTGIGGEMVQFQYVGNGQWQPLSTPSSQINGTISLSQLPPSLVTNTETGVTLGGTFSGDGSGLTNFPSSLVTNTETGVTLGGTFSGNGSGLTGLNTPTIANYVYSYSTTTQIVATVNTFQDITNQVDAQISGWVHAANTATFTNNQTGLYLIEYTAEALTTSSSASTISLRAMLNGAEIFGSQTTALVNLAEQTVPVSRSFIASFGAGDALKFQLAGSATADRIVSNFGLGTTRPSFSCTIIRLQ